MESLAVVGLRGASWPCWTAQIGWIMHIRLRTFERYSRSGSKIQVRCLLKHMLLLPLVVLGACENREEATIYRNDGVAIAVLPSESYNAALSHGIFTIEGNCIALTLDGGRSHTPVFPSEVTIDAIRSSGALYLPLGKRVSIGGSQMSGEWGARSLSAEFKVQCPGPYFAVGPIGPPIEPPPPPPPLAL